MDGEDASTDLLSIIDGDPQTYVEYGKWYFTNLPLDVVNRFCEGVTLTKEMISVLDPKRSEWDEINDGSG